MKPSGGIGSLMVKVHGFVLVAWIKISRLAENQRCMLLATINC